MKKLFFCALILISLTAAANSDTTKVKKCKGITAKGQPCKSAFIPKGAEYCKAHDTNKIRCAGQNSKKEPCKMEVKNKGEFCKFHNK